MWTLIRVYGDAVLYTFDNIFDALVFWNDFEQAYGACYLVSDLGAKFHK